MRNSNGSSGREVEPADSWNESETLVTTSIELEDPDSSEIPCVCLGGTHWHVGDASGPGRRTDGLTSQTDAARGQADVSRYWTDTLIVSDSAEMAVMSDSEGAGTYPGIRDVKHLILEMDGARNHADMSSGCGNILSVETHAIKPTNETANIRLPHKKVKPPNIPVEAAWQHSDEPNGFGDATDALSMPTDGPSIEMEMEMPANETQNIRTLRNTAEKGLRGLGCCYLR